MSVTGQKLMMSIPTSQPLHTLFSQGVLKVRLMWILWLGTN